MVVMTAWMKVVKRVVLMDEMLAVMMVATRVDSMV